MSPPGSPPGVPAPTHPWASRASSVTPDGTASDSGAMRRPPGRTAATTDATTPAPAVTLNAAPRSEPGANGATGP